LETLETKGNKGGDNLISFGTLDEFDPVAQKWAKEQAAAAVPAQDAAAAAPEAVEEAVEYDPDDLLGIGGGTAKKKPGASGENDAGDLEDADKKMIFVYHKGEKNVVGWYSDMSGADIREAILCACDAIIDGGFVLKEVQFTGDDESTAEPKEGGKVYEFEQLDQVENGQTYILESAKEREDLKSVVGDRWRRLHVQIDPLPDKSALQKAAQWSCPGLSKSMHPEAQAALPRKS